MKLLAACTALVLAAHDPSGPHDGPRGHSHRGPQELPGDGPGWERPAPAAEPVFVGDGQHRYRWDSTWLQLPDGREWLGSTHGGIVADAEGHVYLTVDQGAAVQVFDRDGRWLRSFGDDWGAGLHGLAIREEWVPDDEQLASAQGLVRAEVLYLAHTARQVIYRTTLEGAILTTFAAPPATAGIYEDPSHYRPTSVAVAPDRTVFIADGYGRSWIHRYRADGEYLGSFGGRGDGPEHLSTPHGLWIEGDGDEAELLVADRENHRIARFAMDGSFLGGTDPEGGLLRRPCSLQFRGDLGIVADLAGRVTLIDRELGLVTHLGDNPVEGERAQFDVAPDRWRDGVFFAPHGACIGADGALYVMDWNVAGRVTRLVPAPL